MGTFSIGDRERGTATDSNIYFNLLDYLKEEPRHIKDVCDEMEPPLASNQTVMYLEVLHKNELIEHKGQKEWELTEKGKEVMEEYEKYEFPNPFSNPRGSIEERG